MVRLFESDKKDFNRQSSKGNQLKFQKGDIWYKVDYAGSISVKAEYSSSYCLERAACI